MSRTRKNSLAKGKIDCKKAYDTVPHSWIVECLGIFGLAENVKSLSRESRKQNYLNGNNIGKVRRKRGKFDGESLSPLLFVISIIPLSFVLRNSKAGYEWTNKTEINHLLFINALKLYAKEMKQLDSLVHTVRIFSKPWDEIWDRECAILKRGVITKSEAILLTDEYNSGF